MLSYCVCFLFSSMTVEIHEDLCVPSIHAYKNTSHAQKFITSYTLRIYFIFSFKNQLVIGYYAFHINIGFFLGADTRKKLLLSVILSNITQSICQQNRPPKSAQHCHIRMVKIFSSHALLMYSFV